MDHESLVQQMEQLSRDLKETTAALNDLSIQIKGIDLVQDKKGTTITQPKHVDVKEPQRTYGYVNWNTTHDILKTENWKKMSVFTDFCGKLERGGIPNFYTYINMDDKKVVDEENRFPEDDLYVNVNNPLVRTEILYIKELRGRKPAVGLVDRFLTVAKNEMHTFSSFEKKYGLKWINPLPEASNIVEAEPVQDIPEPSADPVETPIVISGISDSWCSENTKIEEVDLDRSAMNEVLSTDELAVKELSIQFTDFLNQLSHMNFDFMLRKVKDFHINDQNRLEVIANLLFEKALETPNSSSLYAILARKLSTLTVLSGSKINLNFRRLIIDKCQAEFECYVTNEKEFAEANDIEIEKELQMGLSEKNAIARNRAVAIVKFIGELYKSKMLTYKIVEYCLQKLSDKFEEDKIECLCELLATAGQQLDSKILDNIFSNLHDIIEFKSDQISSSAYFMIQDIIDLRNRKWVKAIKKGFTAFPKTLDEIQEESEKRALLIELMNTFDVSAGSGSDDRNVVIRQKETLSGRDTDKKLYTVDFLKREATSKNTQNYIKVPPKTFQNLSLFSILEKLQADPTSRADTLTADRDVTPTYHSTNSDDERLDLSAGYLQAQTITDLQKIKAAKCTAEQYLMYADEDEVVDDVKELFPPQELLVSGKR